MKFYYLFKLFVHNCGMIIIRLILSKSPMFSNLIEIISVSYFTKLKSYVISFKGSSLKISLLFYFSGKEDSML